MQYQKLLIERDPMEKLTVIVPTYETPILEAVHGAHNVSVLEANISISSTPPDPQDEYDRLERRYGDHPQMGISYAEYVHRGHLPEDAFAKRRGRKPKVEAQGEAQGEAA